MKRIIIASLAATALSCPLAHADLLFKAPPLPAPTFSWAGLYVGVDGGYGWSTSNDQLALSGDHPTGLFSQGGFGGSEIGYNFQIGQIVYGLEVDFQGTGIADTVQDLNFGDTFHSELDWFGTARGRLGYAFDRALFYVTGGLAYGRIENSVFGPTLLGSPYNFSGIDIGYALGGGLEYAISPLWSFKVEYQYMNLGKNDPTDPTGAHYSAIGGGGFSTVRADAFNTIRAGVNLKFTTW